MFTCTGKCAQCGRCRPRGSTEEVNERKARLLFFPPDFVPRREETGFGIAIDIGTTTVVGLLWDLHQGKLRSTKALTNPQISHGADVISRIAFSMEGNDHLQLLQNEITECINTIIEKTSEECNVNPESIIRVVACGNTTMSHLLLGVDPGSLARAPFRPGYTGTVLLNSREIGIRINENGTVMVMPNIARHVGGDISAGILAVRMGRHKECTLLVDIGTNGEIALHSEGRIWVCSTAAGPAFEGASIYQGMRAEKGAIEHLRIQEGDVAFHVIGDVPPIGICGSGLVDAVAEMIRNGIIDKTGRILTEKEYVSKYGESPLCNRLIEDDTGRKFILVQKEKGEDIVLTQNDIREVQLAKAAIRAGIRILMAKAGISIEQIDHVYLAGAFGNYIDRWSAITIGMLPEIETEKLIPVGNAAGTGTLMVLDNQEEGECLFQILARTTHVNLSEEGTFQKEYLASMYFNTG